MNFNVAIFSGDTLDCMQRIFCSRPQRPQVCFSVHGETVSNIFITHKHNTHVMQQNFIFFLTQRHEQKTSPSCYFYMSQQIKGDIVQV